MNTAVNRLIWKEYRSQRAIWLTVVIGALMVWLLMRLDQSNFNLLMIVVSAIMTGIVTTLLSLLVAFAGELDNRTDVFLRMLPCRTSHLFAGKLALIACGAVLTMTAFFVGVFMIEGIILLLQQQFPLLFRGGFESKPLPEEFWKDLLLFVAFFLGLTAITLFSTLVTRKVFSAAFLAMILTPALFWLGPMVRALIGSPHSGPIKEVELSIWYLSTTLVFLTVSFVLAKPWHRGTVPFEFRWRSSHSVSSVESSRSWWLPSRWLRSWLKDAAARPESRGRVLQSLACKELRSVVPFLVVAIPAIVAGYVMDLTTAGTAGTPIFMVVIPLLVCFECGQRSLRDDQISGTLKTLASMGLSPGTIWLSRTAVWFTTASVSIASLLLLDWLYSWMISAPADRTVLLRDNTAAQMWRYVGTMYQDVFSDYGLAVIIATFSIGQLAAAWIERQILAFAVGLLSIAVFNFFVAVVVHLDWSLWLTVLPTALVLLSVAGWTSREWVEGQWSGRIGLRRAAMICLPVLMLCAIGWTYWRYEPRWAMKRFMASPDFLNSNSRMPADIDKLSTTFWAEVSSEADPQSPWTEFSRRFPVTVPPRKSAYERQLAWAYKPFAEPQTAEQIAELLRPFESLLRKRSQDWPALPIELTATWWPEAPPSLSIVGVLLEDARLRIESGQFQTAGERLILAVDLSRRISQQTSNWDQWFGCLIVEGHVLDRLRSLVNLHAAELDLPPLADSLREVAFVYLDEEQRQVFQTPNPSPMLARRTQFARLLAQVNGDAGLRRQLAQKIDPGNIHIAEDLLLHTAARVSMRDAESTAYSELIVRTKLASVLIGGNMMFDARATPLFERHAQLAPMFATANVRGFNLDIDSEVTSAVPHYNPAIVAIATTLANERATLLTLLLHQHRKEHGALPSTLFELNDEHAGNYVRIDPFTGESFFYSRDGISKPLNLTRGERDPDKQRWAPSTQPVLCSAGPYGRILELSSHRLKDDTSSPRFLQLPEHAIVCILPSMAQDETILNLPMQPASAEIK